MDGHPTLQQVIVAALDGESLLRLPEPDGLGFEGVYGKWLVETGNGAEPDAFTTGGRIKPNIVVLMSDRNPHPSVAIPGWAKSDQFVSVYLFHYPGDHGKAVLEAGALIVEDVLAALRPIITGGILPKIHPNPSVNDIDDPQQFSGNYVKVLRFRVTGLRAVPIA